MSRSVAAYFVCIALVPLYVNMFTVWKYISSHLGSTFFIYMPTVVTTILVAAIITVVHRKNRRQGVTVLPRAIAIGVLLCAVGLIIPDPAFPVKRIHVAEYLFLALVARFAMAPFLDRVPLLFFSSCFAAILGMHDEFLQGIHPARTFGLRDMTVNALASFGGGLIWHALSLFTMKPPTDNHTSSARPDLNSGLYLCWLLTSALMLAIPAVFFRGMVIELWMIAPLLGSIVYFSLYRSHFNKPLRHGITALSCAVWGLAGYPLISGMKAVIFY